MKLGFTSIFILLPVYDTETVKISYQKIGFALKTDAAKQGGVHSLVADVYNID